MIPIMILMRNGSEVAIFEPYNHSTTELSTEILSKVSFGSWFRASANCLYKPFIEYHTRKLLLNNRISFSILKNSALFGRGYSIVPLEGRDPEKYKFELFATCLLSFYRIKTWWEKKTICISSPTSVTTMYIITDDHVYRYLLCANHLKMIANIPCAFLHSSLVGLSFKFCTRMLR